MKSKVVRIKEDAIDILLKYDENLSNAVHNMHSTIKRYQKEETNE